MHTKINFKETKNKGDQSVRTSTVGSTWFLVICSATHLGVFRCGSNSKT